MVNIVVIPGSSRKDSYNKKLARVAAAAAQDAGAKVGYVDLKEYNLPLYDGDLEEESGIPTKAKELKELIRNCQGLIIASPEYNSGISAVLKNAIDWASRSEGDEGPGEVFEGKYAAIMSASPGGLGGLRGLYHLRYVLQNLDITVVAGLTTVGAAYDAFDGGGNFKDEEKAAEVKQVATDLVNLLKKLQ